MLTTHILTGDTLTSALDDVARLRISVFRDWPYLYDGDLAYEREYLKAYQSPQAVVVVAKDGDRIVGAATGAPMIEHAVEFSAAFANRSEDISEIFYCAESVLLSAYRGRGIGHAFFDARESHARGTNHRFSAFCSVIRPKTHPDAPAGYRSLDTFWRKRGYMPLENTIAEFSWRDVGQEQETIKPLQFWMKAL